ncbi:MAG: hypothetical protein ACRDPJ_20845 [Nocardioidaceae bacterium]
MSADHKKPVVAFVVLALLAVAVVCVQFRADAFRARFVALGSLTLGRTEAHGVVELPRPKADSGDLSRRRTPSRAVRRDPVAEERSRAVGPGSDEVGRGRGSVGVGGDDVRPGRGSWRGSHDAGTNPEVARAAQVRRFGHHVKHLSGPLTELGIDRDLRRPDTGDASLRWLLEHTTAADGWGSSHRWR